MSWNQGSGGPWAPRNPPGGPWGNGPKGPGGGPGGPGKGGPPDLEALFRRGQDRFRGALPGGSGLGGRGLLLLGLLALVGWLATGVFTVQQNQVGLKLVFGRYAATSAPGLGYNWPYPLGRVIKLPISPQTTEVGMRRADARRGGLGRDVPEESLMLTGDENIVDVDFVVIWALDPQRPQDYAFNLANVDGTVRAVAEAAMREVVGRNDIQPVLTGARQRIEQGVQELMQRVLNDYNAGVRVQQVQMAKVDPPSQVIDAFRDVQAARADQERAQNEAQTYANKVVPEARGEASRITQRAEAEGERLIADARGQAAGFLKVQEAYRLAPEVTRQRLYIETMERVLSGTDKVIVDQPNGAQGVVPFLPLNDLSRRGPQPGAAAGAAR